MQKKAVQVWDLPTRLFHWSLLTLVTVSWFTGEGEGAAALVHRVSGEAIVGLLVFRIIWGFVGGEHARFKSFIATPQATVAHIRELFSFRAEQTLGHNPLGGLFSLLLIAVVAATALTGLLSASDEGPSGPLAAVFAVNLEEAHEVIFRILQALVVLHIAGVAITSVASRDNLLGAMITGRKSRDPQSDARDARRGSKFALAASAVLALGAAGALMALPHPASLNDDGADRYDRESDNHDDDD